MQGKNDDDAENINVVRRRSNASEITGNNVTVEIDLNSEYPLKQNPGWD